MLSEVVVQGVRRFGDVHRFPLKPGYNVIYGLAESGKSTVYDVMRSLLFARPAEGEKETFSSWRQDAGDVCRAGLTITAGSKLFRVMKDYTTGKATLSKLDPAAKKFVLMLDSPQQIQRWLREALRVPVGPEFGRLFTVTHDDIPSTNISTDRPKPGEQFEAEIRSWSVQQKKETLEQQCSDYKASAELGEIEQQQIELRSRVDELAMLLKRADEAQTALDQAEAAFEPFKLQPKLPDDIETKVAEYTEQLRERDAMLAELKPQHEMAMGGLKATEVVEPWKDPLGIGGAVGVVIGFVLAAVLTGGLRYLAYLVILGGFGVIGWRIFNWVRAQEEHTEHKQSVTQSGEKIRVLEKTFEVETAVVRSFMKQLGVEDAGQLVEHKAARQQAEQQLDQARSALDAVSADADVPAARAEHKELTAKLEALESRLAEIGGGGMLAGVDRPTRVARAFLLETEIAQAEGRRPRPPSTLMDDDSIDDDLYADSVSDPALTALQRYCAARQADPPTVMRSIHEAFNRNLEAFTGGQWRKAVFHSNGRISVRSDGGQEPVPLDSLSANEQDAAYAALRFTLFQLESKGGPPIVMLDDPFDFDEGRSKLLARALHALGKSGQVLHFTSMPSLTRFADHSVEL